MLLVIYARRGLMVSEIRYYSFKEIRFHRRHPFPVLLGLILLIYADRSARRRSMLFLGIVGLRALGPLAVVAAGCAARRSAGGNAERPPAGARSARRRAGATFAA